MPAATGQTPPTASVSRRPTRQPAQPQAAAKKSNSKNRFLRYAPPMTIVVAEARRAFFAAARAALPRASRAADFAARAFLPRASRAVGFAARAVLLRAGRAARALAAQKATCRATSAIAASRDAAGERGAHAFS